MSTTSDNLWRCDWTFAILCALAFFLAGVTATLAMCNAERAPDLAFSARLAPRAAPQPILMAAVESRPISSAAVNPIVRVTLKPTTYVMPVKGTYRNYTVQPGQTLSRLDPEGWQHTCEINKQSGNIKTRDCKITAGTSIILPVAIVIALSQQEESPARHLANTDRTAEHKMLGINERLRLAEVARERFCSQQVSNEKLPACEPEWAARIQMQALALTVGKQSS